MPTLPNCYVTFGGEGAQAVALPTGAEVVGVCVNYATKLPGHVKECAEQGCAVIIREFNQTGFLHEAAQLDQVSGAFAPCLGPITRVSPGACGIEAVTLHY